MREYDEYQKSRRYKNGFQAFWILTGLLFVNTSLRTYDIQWGATESIETLILWSLTFAYFVLKSAYDGAFFDRLENPKTKSVFSFLFGCFILFVYSRSFPDFIVDGKIGIDFIMLIPGIIWIAAPIGHLLRVLKEKRIERKENNLH